MVGVKYTESDFYGLFLSECDKSLISNYLKLMNNETLARKVSVSLDQRNQGYFDKAMLNISEVNRDQVIAIREIQKIIDKLEDREEAEIILEKYRQTYPFQIGLRNGEDILNLLSQVKSNFIDGYRQVTSELYSNENEVSLLVEELIFFEERMIGKITVKELDAMRANISKLQDKILLTKKIIINNILYYISKNINITDSDDKLRLTKNIYLIITSSVETLDATLVDV